MQIFDFESIINNFLASTKNISAHSKKLFSVAFPIQINNPSLVIDMIFSEGIDLTLFSLPKKKKTFLGIDSVREWLDLTFSDSERHKEIENLINNRISNFADFSLSEIPTVFCSIKFSESDSNSQLWRDFNNSNWIIPKFIFAKNASNTFLILNFYCEQISFSTIYSYLFSLYKLIPIIHKSDDTTIIKGIKSGEVYENWVAGVNNILNLIKKKNFRKIVLSRMVSYKLITEINFFNVISKLSEKFPDTTIFLFSRNKSVFFGATPELLFNFNDSKISTEALAGSAPRGQGKEEDELLERDLLANTKNRNEQKMVVEYITNAISNIVTDIEFNDIPKMKKLLNIQHLQTKISGRVKDKISVFDLIEAIYPTPAICGIPAENAKEKIIQIENYCRGLYSGIVGWLDEKVNGSFYVAIRSALIKDKKLYAFAGCGIVEGSNADSEFEETKLKLKSILSLFDEEK